MCCPYYAKGSNMGVEDERGKSLTTLEKLLASTEPDKVYLIWIQ